MDKSITLKTIAVLVLVVNLVGCFGPPGGGHGGGGRPMGQKEQSSEEFMERLDSNGDGVISIDEFDGPEEDFELFDVDGDGSISLEEVPSNPPPMKRS